MATNSIKLFDDTVIKLSVNQGLEDQRATEILGNFTSGELAFTRDTGRLFVGDNSDGEAEHQGIQETIGGTLVGNKYLGLVDSKPLVTFQNNGTPLSYEKETLYTGTQESANFKEPGLFTDKSKFRLHHTNPNWDNWDRTATYNPKYNAYNGDFMYDVYQNALILFDTRISGEKNSPTQPQFKSGAATETFIVDGKEIPSTSTEALNVKRRTKLQNYVKENDEVTNGNMVYGDGYVILRQVEPDNQTIRFKPRGFQQNGNPENENNYSHNILEVFNIPSSAFSGNFSDDFYIASEKVYLTKDIKDVKSITGSGGKLKIPGKLCFSNAKSGTRGATTYMEWDFTEPQLKDIPVPSNGTKYNFVLTPQSKQTEDGKQYVVFNGSVEKIVPTTYTFNLGDGLESDQSNVKMLKLDEKAAGSDPTKYPTLKLNLSDADPVLTEGDDDPYLTDASDSSIMHTGNLGIGGDGRVRYIDTFDPTVLAAASSKIAKWEEPNTSINFLKTPVTLAQSSAAKHLYSNPTEPTDQKYTIGTNGGGSLSPTTNGTDIINNDFRKLIKKVTAANKLIAAANKSGTTSSTTTNGVTFASNALSISSVTTAGLGVALSGNNLDINSHVRTVNIEGTVTGLDNKQGTCQVFAAVVDASVSTDVKILTVQQLQRSFSNFSFNIFLDAHTVVRKTGVFVVMGIILDVTSDTLSNVKVEYKTMNLSQAKSLKDEMMFMLSDVGVNVNTDFNVSPYVFCAKKLVSCPNEKVLPKPDNTTFPGTSGGTAYFNKLDTQNSTYTFIKSWNNLFKVLGHNHYKDLANGEKNGVYTTGTSKYNITGAAFKAFEQYEFDATSKTIKTHTTVDVNNSQYMAWAWYEEYSNGGESQDKVYYPYNNFEVRYSSFIDDSNKYLTYAKLSNGKYLFKNGGGGETVPANCIISGNEETVSSTKKRKLKCVFVENSCLDGVTHIQYGSESFSAIYDFETYKGLAFTNSVYIDSDVAKVILVNGTSSQTKEIASPTKNKEVFATDATSAIGNGGTGNISDYNYLVLQSSDANSNIVYKIEKSVNYVTGFKEPGSLSSVKIFVESDSNTSNGGTIQTANLNEALTEEEKVYIPTTARNILLEITHVTTDNNTVAVFYANKFEDLAILHSGYKTKEWNDPAQFVSDIILNPSYEQPFSDGNFVNGSGTYRLTLGKSIGTVNGTTFHSLDKAPSTECPSVFAAAPNEKCLMNSSVTETRVIEVPLHKIPGSDTRHFALRFANIRPSDENVLNQVVVRIIGYRV